MSTTARYAEPADVATLLGVHRQTVYRLIHRGDIRAVRVGRQWRVPASELRRLERHTPHAA